MARVTLAFSGALVIALLLTRALAVDRAPALTATTAEPVITPRSHARRRRPSVLPPVVMLLAALVLVGLGLLVARGGHHHFDGLWPVGPSIAFVCVLLLLVTVAAVGVRRRQRVRHERAVDRMLDRWGMLLSADPQSRGSETSELVPQLALVREASQGLPSDERAEVLHVMLEAGATALVERQATSRRSREDRAEALGLLGWLGSEHSVPVLTEVMRGADGDLAYVAGQALASQDRREAFSVLVEALRNEWLPRSRIATLLESSRFADAPATLNALASDADSDVRFWAAYLLGRCGKGTQAASLDRLAADPDLSVRANAVEASGRIGDVAKARELVSDPSWVVRCHAAKALGRARDTASAQQLAALLTDRFSWVRENATQALINIGTPAVPELLPVLGGSDRFARNKAAEVLVAIGYVDHQVQLLISASNGDADQPTARLMAVARAEAAGSVRARLVAAADQGAAVAAALERLDQLTAPRHR